MGPMGDAAGEGAYPKTPGQKGELQESREEEALRRSWCEYQRAMEDREVMFTSRLRYKGDNRRAREVGARSHDPPGVIPAFHRRV